MQCSALPWGLMVEGIKEQGTKRKRNKGHLLFTSTRVGQKRRRAAVAACGTNYANRMQKLNNLLKTTQKMFFVFFFFHLKRGNRFQAKQLRNAQPFVQFPTRRLSGKKNPSPHCVKYNFVFKEPKEDKSLSFFFISLMSAVLHARTQHAAVREEIPKAPHNKPRNEKEAKVPLGRSFSSSSSFSSFRFWSLGRSTPHTHTHRHTHTYTQTWRKRRSGEENVVVVFVAGLFRISL